MLPDLDPATCPWSTFQDRARRVSDACCIPHEAAIATSSDTTIPGTGICERRDALHAVRCCSESELPLYEQVGGCGVYARSQFDAETGDTVCMQSSDLHEARDICFREGARLCSVAEVEQGCTEVGDCALPPTGLVWTDEPCTGQAGTACTHGLPDECSFECGRETTAFLLDCNKTTSAVFDAYEDAEVRHWQTSVHTPF